MDAASTHFWDVQAVVDSSSITQMFRVVEI
jgi:hypothetical protein